MAIDKNRSLADEEFPYSTWTFWRAYSALYWPDLNNNIKLKETAEFLWNKLSSAIPQDQPIRILALGFGYGGTELPVLYHLKKFAGDRPIHLVAVEKQEGPLAFAKNLLEPGGILDIPANPERMQEKFQAVLKDTRLVPWWGYDIRQFAFNPEFRERELYQFDGGNDRFWFWRDDLLWEPSQDEQLYPRPSTWANRLAKYLVRNEFEAPFDIVISAFCFFHLPLWRVTLMTALQLLREESGFFLHAKVEGDEGIFEGRPTFSQSNLSEHNTKMAESIFHKLFFADKRVKRWQELPRGASASRPYVIEDIFDRLRSFGVKPIGDDDEGQLRLRYSVPARMMKDDYKDLLATRGFSTFRMTAEHIGGDDAYKNLVKESLSEIDSDNKDVLDIVFQWSAHRVNLQNLNKFPLLSRFAMPPALPDQQQQCEGPLESAYRTEYELSAAACLHTTTVKDRDEKDTIAGINKTFIELGSKVVEQGLLGDKCLGWEYGYLPRGRAGRANWIFFPKLLGIDVQTRDRVGKHLASYLGLMRLAPRSESFSNSKTNLDVLIKYFPHHSCLLSYEIRPDEQWDFEWDVKSFSGRRYVELRFILPGLEPNYRKKINQLLDSLQVTLESDKESYSGSQQESTSKDNSSKQGRSNGRLVLAANEIKLDGKYNGEPAAEKIKDFFTKGPCGPTEELRNNLKEKINKIDILPEKERTELRDAIFSNWEAWHYRASLLRLFTDLRYLCFFPATHEVEGQVFGRDLSIGLYREVLTSREISTEIIKSDHMFESIIRWEQDERNKGQGIKEATIAYSHEVANSTSFLFGQFMKRLSEPFTIKSGVTTVNASWSSPLGEIELASTAAASSVDCLELGFFPSWEVLEGVKANMIIWAGGSDCISGLDLVGKGNDGEAFSTVLDKLLKLSKKSRAFHSVRGNSLNTVESVAGVKIDFETALSNLPTVSLKSVPQNLEWPRATLPRQQNLQAAFARAVLAAIGNAIKHAKAEVKVFASLVPGAADESIESIGKYEILRFRCENDFEGNEKGSGSTEAVLEVCYKEFSDQARTTHFGEPDSPGYSSAEGQRKWITEFEVPLLAPVPWLDLKPKCEETRT